MIKKQMKTAGELLVDADDQARRFFEPYAGSPPVRALDALSKLGDQPELRTIAIGMIFAGTMTESDRLVRAGARMILAHEAATIAKDLAKTKIDRTRPRSAGDRTEKKPKKGNHTAKEKTSFPSGHSAGAIAAARAFSREFPEYGAAALATAGVIAVAQIPRCAHYPTDVAAGLIIGLALESVTNLAWTTLQMEARSAQ